MKVIDKPVSELRPYARNPRKNDGAVDAVAASIKEFGFKVPIVIDGNGEIVCGHTRLKAAKKLGLTEVPCVIADDLTPEQIKAFRLADNKTAEIAEWDVDLLDVELKDIELDMTPFGFTDGTDADAATEDNFDADAAAEEIETPVTERGDVWQLGEHRLICGDSTERADMLKLMSGGKADLIVTDPPYNIDYGDKFAVKLRVDPTYGKRKVRKIANDKKTDAEFAEFLRQAYKNAYENTKSGGAIYVFYSEISSVVFRTELESAGFMWKATLVWIKNNITLSLSDYHYRHEPILYGWKGGAAHYFTDDRTQQNVFDNKVNVKKLTKAEMQSMLESILGDKTPTMVLYEDKPQKSPDHPTMKPIKLLARLIRNSSRLGETVLDPFAGSGSTLIAAEQLGRRCYAMELDPKYCDVIVRRFEEFTGQKAVKI